MKPLLADALSLVGIGFIVVSCVFAAIEEMGTKWILIPMFVGVASWLAGVALNRRACQEGMGRSVYRKDEDERRRDED